MHQNWKIEHWEHEYVYTHIRVAHLRFGNIKLPYCHQVVLVGFRAEVALVLLEVHPFLCASSASAKSLLSHFSK